MKGIRLFAILETLYIYKPYQNEYVLYIFEIIFINWNSEYNFFLENSNVFWTAGYRCFNPES